MAFHPAGHKPKLVRRKLKFDWKLRSMTGLAGAIFILLGGLNLKRGVFAGTNSVGQPVYSTSLILVGFILAIGAFTPPS